MAEAYMSTEIRPLQFRLSLPDRKSDTSLFESVIPSESVIPFESVISSESVIPRCEEVFWKPELSSAGRSRARLAGRAVQSKGALLDSM